jgi:hypothetical protein
MVMKKKKKGKRDEKYPCGDGKKITICDLNQQVKIGDTEQARERKQ